MLLSVSPGRTEAPAGYDPIWSGRDGTSSLGLWYDSARPFARRIQKQAVQNERGVALLVGCPYADSRSVTPVDNRTLETWLTEFAGSGRRTFLNTIDGPFAVVLIAQRPRRILVATDLRSQFPIYYYHRNGELAAGWRVADLVRATGLRPTLSYGSVLSAVANGLLLGPTTYYHEIRKLLPGECLIGENGRTVVERYWARDFSRPGTVTGEEFAACITEAVTTELKRAGGKTVLGLSGGIDSRALLAVLARTKTVIDAATWGWDRLDLPFGDYQAGEKLARHVGLPHRAYPLDPDRVIDYIRPIVDETEGMILHIGSFPDGETVARELGQRYETILFGGHCLGMGPRGRTLRAALLSAGIRTGLYARAAASLLRPGIRGRALAEYRAQVDEFVAPFRNARGDWQDLADYYHTSPRMEAGLHWVWLKYLYPSCPLHARPVLELSNRLTRAQRFDKGFFSRTVQDHLWPGEPWPTNTKNSRIDWEGRIERPGRLARGLANIVAEESEAFFEVFDRDQVLNWLRYTLPAAPGLKPGRTGFGRGLYNQVLWHRTRNIQLAYLAVVKLTKW